MRVFLMLGGAAISVGALLFWIYLNELAASWSTSNIKPPIDWLSWDALYFFWLPFAVGAAIALIGWKWQRRAGMGH
jgi:hypothetical protein